jgi:hypothetical protein
MEAARYPLPSAAHEGQHDHDRAAQPSHSEICILAGNGLVRFDRSLLMSVEIDAAIDGSKCFTAPA